VIYQNICQNVFLGKYDVTWHDKNGEYDAIEFKFNNIKTRTEKWESKITQEEVGQL